MRRWRKKKTHSMIKLKEESYFTGEKLTSRLYIYMELDIRNLAGCIWKRKKRLNPVGLLLIGGLDKKKTF